MAARDFYSEVRPFAHAGVPAPRDHAKSGTHLVANLLVVSALTLAGYILFTVYESRTLGLPVFRYEPALFTPYHLIRSCFALASSALLIWVITRERTAENTLAAKSLSPRSLGVACSVMAAAIACVCLFAVSPASFDALAIEDGPVEWSTAFLVFLSSALFTCDCYNRWRTRNDGIKSTGVGIAISAGLAFGFFVVGMEEISWMQRILGFSTPAGLAQLNWQREFNLHNTHTFVFQCVYYFGAGILLILLPFLHETVPGWRPLRPFSDFIPSRAIAAASAPISMFNYGHWNLIPTQVSFMITGWVLLAYSRAAARRSSRLECVLFLGLFTSVVVGQAIFLVMGPSPSRIPDTTEYEELFIAVGMSGFAWEATRRAKLRSAPLDAGRPFSQASAAMVKTAQWFKNPG